MNKILVAFLVSALVIASVSGQRRQRNRGRNRGGNCHMKELEKCFDKLSKQSNDPESSKLITTSKGLEEICSNTKGVIKCVKAFLKKCGTPLQRELLDFGTEHFEKSVDLFCKSGSSRTTLLKHTPCINDNVLKQATYKDGCVNPFLASLDAVAKIEVPDDRLDAVCCSYRRWDDCSSKMISDKCGPPAQEAMDGLFKKAFAGFSDMICSARHFDFKSNKCKKLYAPPGTKPKGKLSENPLTRYIALYFGFLF